MQSPQTNSTREQLRVFRATHHSRAHVVGAHVWDVIAAGQGEPALVLLPGAGGSAESQFHLIDRFEKRARVLAIGCPATLTRIADAVAGIQKILDDAGVRSCFLLGQSLGGIFAQGYACAFGERVDGLILANTAHYSALHARVVGMVLSSAPHLPRKAVTAVVEARVQRLLQGHPDRDFWLEYFGRDEFERIGSRGIANLGACIADSVRYGGRYAGPTLIIESDNDTAFTAAERQALRETYPQANVRVFHGAGHLSGITRCDEFVAEVSEFMAPSQSPQLR